MNRKTQQGKQVPQKNETRSASVSQQTIAYRSSPLPPPEEMTRYEQIFPGFAELVTKNFVKEGEHRRESESRIDKANIDIKTRQSKLPLLGMIFAFFLCLSFLVSSVALIFWGHTWTGVGFAAAGFLTLIGKFLPDNQGNKSS